MCIRDSDLDAFEHAADWDPVSSWIDIRVRSLADQQVRVEGLDLTIDVAKGEEIRTEVSTKFSLEGIAAELKAEGLSLTKQWTDADGDFALTLATKL